MIDPKIRNIILEMKATKFGQALDVYLSNKIQEIDTVKGCNSIEEVKGREIALGILAELHSLLNREQSNNRPKSSFE